MAFGNLTVDFTRLMSVPVRDRATLAKSPQASEIFGNMTPTEIAMLFPDYYKRFIPKTSAGAAMSSGMTAPPGTMQQTTSTGGGTSGATPALSAPPPSQNYIDEILQTANPIPVSSSKFEGSFAQKSNVLTTRMMKDLGLTKEQAAGFVGNLAHESAGLNVNIEEKAANVHGTRGYGLAQWTDPSPGKGRRTNLINFAKERNIAVNDFETQYQFLLHELNGVESKALARIRSARTVEEAAAAAVYFERPSGFTKEAWKTSDMISVAKRVHGWDSRFKYSQKALSAYDEYAEIAETLPGTQPEEKTKLPGSETSTDITKPDYMREFDPAIFTQLDSRLKDYYYNVASDAEKKQLEKAILKLGISGVQDIMTKHPEKTATAVSDKVYQESNKRFTESSSASNFYTGLRKQYPEKIDVNSELWNQIDPELSKARKQLVDAETGLVGRDALLAADSSAKVLRNNNYIPRIASGGDNHSANHGSGRDANYSIDLAASVVDKQGKIVPVQLGKGVPEKIKNDMATAAYFASIGAEGGHRVGYPDASTHHSMHIQQDPDRRTAYWGYSETAKRMGIGSSKLATLNATDEGRRFLAERETINRLTSEQKAEYFDKITGLKEQQTAEVAQQTAEPVPGPLPGTEPEQKTKPPGSETSTDITKPNTNMKLGGTVSNLAQEQLSIVNRETGETKLNFNPSEEVTFNKDGRGDVDVKNEYQQRTEDTKQKTDMSDVQQQNQYAMRQTSPKESNFRETRFHEQSKEGAVQYSPSVERHVRNSRFNDSHFSRGSPNSYT